MSKTSHAIKQAQTYVSIQTHEAPMSHLLFAISGSVAVLDMVAWLRHRVTTLLPLLDKWGWSPCSVSGLSSWPESSSSPPECFPVPLWTDRMHQEKQPGNSIASLSRASITTKMEARTAPNIIWSNMFLEVQHYPLLSGKMFPRKLTEIIESLCNVTLSKHV